MLRKRTLFWITTALIVVAFAAAACGDDDDDDGGGFVAADRASLGEEAAGEADGDLAPSSVGVADEGVGGGSSDLLPAIDRRIIFSADLDLEVEQVAIAFNDVARIARNAGGFVESSNLSLRSVGDDGERQFAVLTLRVPVTQYDAVLADLRTLRDATVTAEHSQATEVTEEYTDLQSRLRNLEATEARYLALLDRAETIEDILRVDDRLDGVRFEIERIQGRLNVLDDLTAMANVNVTLSPPPPVAVAAESESGPRQAFEDAWQASLSVLEGGVIVLAYLAASAVWVVPLALVVFVGVRVSRRYREPSAS